ncbi:hypothetical protein [Quadrisphaera setariae]|uniref:Uncharacterized protein n=1 Tax=Quadrisphaera setariae TaxID=2593304 RepID=A0A5C8ZJ84_9ACTN|nr:hypothetical protein [Quadrisphaera setariae]TXR57927.1 hypothetical protein FMM08_01450 [Quadrisphaera setariae]
MSETDPADLADQLRPAVPDEDDAAADLDRPIGDVEASEADVVEQRLVVPDLAEDDDEETR